MFNPARELISNVLGGAMSKLNSDRFGIDLHGTGIQSGSVADVAKCITLLRYAGDGICMREVGFKRSSIIWIEFCFLTRSEFAEWLSKHSNC